MKTIKYFLECNFATPMNTPGIGNPSAPEGTQVGSGDIPIGNIKKLKKKKYKRIKEFLELRNFQLRNIIFELDESSLEYINEDFKQLILEGNRVVYTSPDGDDLKMGDHATQRQDRPIEKGGDGERITTEEILNMFKYAWHDIMEMNYEGRFKKFYDKKNERLVNAWTIECHCYLEKPENESKIMCVGDRPTNKTLWAVFMIQEEGNKVDIIIKNIFRGEQLKHSRNQERIKIWSNGNIQQIFKR